MATGVKVSKDIETFLKSEWDSHHKYKMTTNEVLRKFPEVRTQAIYSAISRMKKSGILIALDEKSPGRGGQYFALTSVIDEMTSSENAKEESNVNKIPEQAKPEFPVANPFDDVHKKLDQLLKFKPPTYDTIDINALVDNLLTQRNLDGERIVRNITKSNEVVMLTTLNRVLQPEMDGLKQYLTGQNSHTREYILNMKNALSDEIKAMHQPVISDDYQRGLRDGIKLAVDMGLMIPKES